MAQAQIVQVDERDKLFRFGDFIARGRRPSRVREERQVVVVILLVGRLERGSDERPARRAQAGHDRAQPGGPHRSPRSRAIAAVTAAAAMSVPAR